ncbi:maleylpyruvate isomerase family mycothiol-dependent enzyme [Gordonia sp. TBRC 11910]|uniref:Maleylpyruvate isomerase family mycothiol-dependent enzyme n=1 Tax=Gordonia asplenii TaxID=2725283 RepID=A0A848KPE0_9ACTN|nr:maleylpyruvate isomerase family mycothiol-dependent enzyme [Gordonia asplenii]NMO00536.1 maleylpyruvate isomerase family mycothiol-dependent enzyme [Gordonia asplenii]
MTTGLAALAPADRHRAIAGDFAKYVAATTDWDAQSPVGDWRARDVVRHLVDWFPAFLAAGGVTLASTPSVDDDPAAAWAAHSAAVQQLLDGAGAAEDFTHPQIGTFPLPIAVDMFYTADVFMHTWDLARSSGVTPDLDDEFAANLLAGMTPIEEMLRSSGQYGPAKPVAADAGAVAKLAAFIGRDPA